VETVADKTVDGDFTDFTDKKELSTVNPESFRGKSRQDPARPAATKEIEQEQTEKTEAEKPFALSCPCAFALKNRAMRGKMLAKRHAAGLGCGNLKAAIAADGNQPHFPREKARVELDFD
jgi:hypothetical protein